jgi:hypothetical protein
MDPPLVWRILEASRKMRLIVFALGGDASLFVASSIFLEHGCGVGAAEERVYQLGRRHHKVLVLNTVGSMMALYWWILETPRE